MNMKTLATITYSLWTLTKTPAQFSIPTGCSETLLRGRVVEQVYHPFPPDGASKDIGAAAN